MDAKRVESPATVEALWYLARYSADKGLDKEAEEYCLRLQDFNAPEKDNAKSLLKSLQQRRLQPPQPPQPQPPPIDSATAQLAAELVGQLTRSMGTSWLPPKKQ